MEIELKKKKKVSTKVSKKWHELIQNVYVQIVLMVSENIFYQ